MKKIIGCLLLILCVETSCNSVPLTPVPTAAPPPASTAAPASILPPTSFETSTPVASPTSLATPTPQADYPLAGYGPQFPPDVNPLTGLKLADPALLNRRPLAIKISNEPRDIRPQWGLSLADLAFEYYTEAGATRFIALYYSQDASKVGPIRSARFFDANVVKGYKAVFAFGGAWMDVLSSLENSAFKNLLVMEGPGSPLTRYDPNGRDLLVVNTADISAYLSKMHKPNTRQDLDGMFFQSQPPLGGNSIQHIYVRYSAATYARWDYDPATGRYDRYEDSADDPNLGLSEQYEQLTDKLSGLPVAFDNVVVLQVNSQYYKLPQPGKNEVMDIQMVGTGLAYVFRDGQAYPAAWKRGDTQVLTLVGPTGQPFPLKPGTTCFEVIGLASTVAQSSQGFRFTNQMP